MGNEDKIDVETDSRFISIRDVINRISVKSVESTWRGIASAKELMVNLIGDKGILRLLGKYDEIYGFRLGVSDEEVKLLSNAIKSINNVWDANGFFVLSDVGFRINDLCKAIGDYSGYWYPSAYEILTDKYKLEGKIDGVIRHLGTVVAERDKVIESLKDDVKILLKKLSNKRNRFYFPEKNNNDLFVLQEDINEALKREQPELALDRLHTYCIKVLHKICSDNNIEIKSDKNDKFPIHSLVGKIKKYYEDKKSFSYFTLMVLRNCISLFDGYNNIRNNYSYAHDNEVLDKIEANFVVNIMIDVINFIDDVENLNKS